MLTQTYFGNGEFEFIESRAEREYYQNMHKAITRTELWVWLRNYTPPADCGFMMSTTPEMKRINAEASKEDVFGGHSGCSHAFTMRAMQAIAKHGYEEFKRTRTVSTATVSTATVRTALSRRAVLNRYVEYDEIIDVETSNHDTIDIEHDRRYILDIYTVRPPAPPSIV